MFMAYETSVLSNTPAPVTVCSGRAHLSACLRCQANLPRLVCRCAPKPTPSCEVTLSERHRKARHETVALVVLITSNVIYVLAYSQFAESIGGDNVGIGLCNTILAATTCLANSLSPSLSPSLSLSLYLPPTVINPPLIGECPCCSGGLQIY